MYHDMEDLGQCYVGYDDEVRLPINSDWLLCVWEDACRKDSSSQMNRDATLFLLLSINGEQSNLHTELPELDAIDRFKDLEVSDWKMIF